MRFEEGFSIVMAVWNQLGYTKLAVEHILKNSTGPYELVVIDNGSAANVKSYFDSIRNLADITYRRNEENVGPIKAINQAFAIARRKYIVALHNDLVILEHGWLDRMRRCFESEPSAGVVGLAGRTEIYRNGCVNERSLRHNLQNEDLNEPMAGDTAEVAVVDGLCLSPRREFLEKAGGLDEGFGYMHCYDLDLSLRSIGSGFRNFVVGVKAVHIGNGGRTRKAEEYRRLVADDYGLLKKNCRLLSERWRSLLPIKIDDGPGLP